MSTKSLLTLLILHLTTLALSAQQGVIDSLEAIHNFGTIAEERGPVSHTFLLHNPSQEPMVILRVNTDCGCTTPSYDRQTVLPGDSLPMTITYNPQNRPGSFVKYTRVYTSLASEPIRLTVKGNVATLGRTVESLSAHYQQQVGPLEISNLYLDFPLQPADAENTIRLMVNNPTRTPLEVTIDQIPKFLKISKTHFILKQQEPEELYLTAAPYDEIGPGLWSGWLSLSVQELDSQREGQTHTGGVLVQLAMPPRFDSESDRGPRADINTYQLLSSLPVGTQHYDGTIPLSNVGQEPLIIHSIQSRHPALTIGEVEHTIAPGEKIEIPYHLNLEGISQEGANYKGDFDLLINDPQAPLRNVLIQIPSFTAQ